MPGRWLLESSPNPVDQIGSDGARPRAVLVAVEAQAGAAADAVQELERLADTDGLDVVAHVTQTRPSPDPATFLGTGKVTELQQTVEFEDADVVLVDVS